MMSGSSEPFDNWQLPMWNCHKTVQAARIESIEDFSPGSYILGLQGGKKVLVTKEWMGKRGAHTGGYFVVYEDGYTSFSPSTAFESGYSLAQSTL